MITTILPYLMILVGFAILIKGADLLVERASAVASRFNVSDMVIGLTVVALGSSAPELATSVVAARKGNADIAVGNVMVSAAGLSAPVAFGLSYSSWSVNRLRLLVSKGRSVSHTNFSSICSSLRIYSWHS
jgi:Ca2+/Na+ antiporter